MGARKSSGIRAPSATQRESSAFGSPVPGEHPFLVAVAPEDAGRSCEIGEVPDLLAHHGVDAIEDPVVHGQQLGLVFFRPRLQNRRVQAGYGVRPYSVMMIGLSCRSAQAHSSCSKARSAAARSAVLTYQP